MGGKPLHTILTILMPFVSIHWSITYINMYIRIPTYVFQQPSVSSSAHSSVRPSVRLSIHSSVRPSVRPSVCLSVRPSIRPSVCPSVRLSVCPSIHASVCLSVGPLVCPSVHLAGLGTMLMSVHYSWLCVDICLVCRCENLTMGAGRCTAREVP